LSSWEPFSAENAPEIVPRVTGGAQPMGEIPTPALAHPITDDKRVMRNYPEQPPVIPHSIDNYQLSLKTNRCLDCHRRQFTEGSGAPGAFLFPGNARASIATKASHTNYLT
jgi:nitrate reductase (cytochrome), electron transfer subunit